MTLDEMYKEIDEGSDNLCYGCIHTERDCSEKPCNSCMQWVDGYLTATNYDNNIVNK